MYYQINISYLQKGTEWLLSKQMSSIWYWMIDIMLLVYCIQLVTTALVKQFYQRDKTLSNCNWISEHKYFGPMNSGPVEDLTIAHLQDFSLWMTSTLAEAMLDLPVACLLACELPSEHERVHHSF